MANESPKCTQNEYTQKYFEPVFKTFRTRTQAVILRITDESVPWTTDNAPQWLQGVVNWAWSLAVLFFLGMLSGLGFSWAFL